MSLQLLPRRAAKLPQCKVYEGAPKLGAHRQEPHLHGFLITSGYCCFLSARVAGAPSPGLPAPLTLLVRSLVRWARNKPLPSATQTAWPCPPVGRHGLALPTLPTARSVVAGLQHHGYNPLLSKALGSGSAPSKPHRCGLFFRAVAEQALTSTCRTWSESPSEDGGWLRCREAGGEVQRSIWTRHLQESPIQAHYLFFVPLGRLSSAAGDSSARIWDR